MSDRRTFLSSLILTSAGLAAGCNKQQPNSPGYGPYRPDTKCQDLLKDIKSHDLIKEFSKQDLIKHHNPLYSIENPLGPSPKAVKAIQEVPPYYNFYGIQEHLEGILKEKLSKEMNVPMEQVFLKSGSTQTLRMLVESLTSKSRPVLTSSHDYYFMHEFVRDYRSKIITAPMTKKLAVDLDRLAEYSKTAGLVYLSNPHLPFGMVHTVAAIEKLAQKISPIPLVIDECYIHFLGKDYQKYSCAPLVKENKNIVVTRTFSKAYGLAGLRIGYHAVSKELIPKLDLYCRGMSPLSVAAAIGALEDNDHLEKSRNHVEKTRSLLIEFCKKHQLEYIKGIKTPYFCLLFPNLSESKVKQFYGTKIGMRAIEYPGKRMHFQMISLVEWKFIKTYLDELEKILLS